MEETGSLYEPHRTFEWKIENFLLLQDKLENGYKSAQFSFSGVAWVIWIYPYGRKCDESVGYISLYLKPMSFPKSVTLNLSFSLKTKEEGNALKETDTHLYKEQSGWGWAKFMLRSDLIRRQSELLLSGALTVMCTVKNIEPNIVTEKSFLLPFEFPKIPRSCVQAEKREEFLNASAQTEEGTGVWKLQKHLHEISLSGDASDIILKVEDQEFKSHRCILAARSPVFAAMMKNEMRENVTGVVDIKDVEPKTFSDFLNYLYTGSTKILTSDNVAKLYTAADKYQVDVLKENCLDHMLANVSVENFCDIFTISVQHNEEKLKETCIEFFGKHLLDIIETCKWQSFLCDNPILCNELHIKHIKLNQNTST